MNVALLCALALLTSIAPSPTRDKSKVWLMFFMKGEAKAPAGQDLMTDHLGNMTKQAKLGHLLTAGPLKDPTEQRRGITVVVAQDEGELRSFFKEDPFVKAGIMTVMAAPWKVDRSRFDTILDPVGMAEYRLVLLKRGRGMQPENAEMQRAHADVMNRVAETFGPGVWGEVDGMNKVRQALVVSSKDSDRILAAFSKDPLVAKAILEVEILPLWMSKGAIKG